MTAKRAYSLVAVQVCIAFPREIYSVLLTVGRVRMTYTRVRFVAQISETINSFNVEILLFLDCILFYAVLLFGLWFLRLLLLCGVFGTKIL